MPYLVLLGETFVDFHAAIYFNLGAVMRAQVTMIDQL